MAALRHFRKHRSLIMVGVAFVSLSILLIWAAADRYFWYDEAYSHYIYGQLSSLKTLLVDQQFCCPANNHILNSLYLKIASKIGFTHQLLLRLHSLLAFPFLFFSIFLFGYKVLKQWQPQTNPNRLQAAALGLTVILVSFPLVFHLLFQARGYALAFALMAVSNYLLYKAGVSRREDHKWPLLWAATMLLGLAVWGNLAILNFYMASLGLILLLMVLSRKWKYLIFTGLTNLPLLGYAIYRAWLVSRPGVPLYATPKGFFSGTVKSLFENSVFLPFRDQAVNLLTILFCALIVLCAAMTIPIFLRAPRNWRSDGPLMVVPLAFCAMIAGFYIQAEFLGGRFILGRTAGFLWPLAVFNGLMVCACLHNWNYFRRPLQALPVLVATTKSVLSAGLGLMAILCLFNFYVYYRTPYTRSADLRVFARLISTYIEKHGPGSVGVDWPWEPSTHFYAPHLRGRLELVADKKQTDPGMDLLVTRLPCEAPFTTAVMESVKIAICRNQQSVNPGQ